jgi:crossover junction endodeoxyribonuclease RuvC
MKVLGVDGGIRGGLAVLEIINGQAPVLVAAIDIPTAGVKAKEKVDAIAVQQFLLQHGPAHCYLERSQAMPKQGASSGFKYGYSVGMLEAVVTCCGIPLTIVEPTGWKKFHNLRGADKEASRQRALQLLPVAHGVLARRKDHGRAEAILLALYGVWARPTSAPIEATVTGGAS